MITKCVWNVSVHQRFVCMWNSSHDSCHWSEEFCNGSWGWCANEANVWLRVSKVFFLDSWGWRGMSQILVNGNVIYSIEVLLLSSNARLFGESFWQRRVFGGTCGAFSEETIVRSRPGKRQTTRSDCKNYCREVFCLLLEIFYIQSVDGISWVNVRFQGLFCHNIHVSCIIDYIVKHRLI